MSAKQYALYSGVAAVLLLLVWAVILSCMGESSKISVAVGGFIAGWYLKKIVERAISVMRSA